MKFELWLAFLTAYTIISIIPGPSVLAVIGQTLSHGVKAALICILGELAGGAILITLAMFGVGALMAISTEIFQILKWAGIAYMAYLGMQQIIEVRKAKAAIIKTSQKKQMLVSFRLGLFTAISNPKAIVFYSALLSQFLNPNSSMTIQFLIVLITSTVIVGLVLGTYALLASQAQKFLQSEKSQRYLGYTGGGFLIGGSAFMATTR